MARVEGNLVRASSGVFIISTLVWGSVVCSAQTLSKAEDLYKRTEYEASIALVEKGSHDPAAQFLLGRDFFMLGDFKKSSEYLQKAVASNPGNSEYVDWLGRAYGRRAETSNPLFAPGLASKARQAFEQAVALDGKNADALSDLFDYYLDAPGFLGGGYDKASTVAEKIGVIDPTEAYFEKAKLAQKRREFDTAEQHLKQAVAAAPQKVAGLLEYAKFLSKQGRTRETDILLAKAEQLQPEMPSVWYTHADILVHERRNLDQAKVLLQRYLHASLTVDDPPREDAAKLLKQIQGA